MPHDPALQALAAHYQAMPPVAALQLRIAGFDGDCLRLHAPLSAHVNDKGCAFGGSLGSLMTLAGWGLVTLRLQRTGMAAEVYVADNSVRYRAPLYADLEAEARLADGESWDAVAAALRERGRARVFLQACVRLPDGGIAAEGGARFVAIARTG
jgi:thioesterase domain-containing protein